MNNFKDILDQFSLSDILEQLDEEKIKASMENLSGKLSQIKASGEAGGGLVRIEMDGSYKTRSCKIDPSLFAEENKEMLEDLLVAAFNIAHQNIECKIEEESKEK